MTPRTSFGEIKAIAKELDVALAKLGTIESAGKPRGPAVEAAMSAAARVYAALRAHELLYGTGGPEPRGLLNVCAD